MNFPRATLRTSSKRIQRALATTTLDVLFNDFDDDSGVEKSSEFLITASMIQGRQLGTEVKLKCHRTKPIQIGPTWEWYNGMAPF